MGLVEDDQLAEVYLERENEYTLAGSIYKGRVTRVLPGMQSAFVDIGLERDAFLYVSDFMELEEHDDDLTDVIPTNRPPLQDMRPHQESRPHRAHARNFCDPPTDGCVERDRVRTFCEDGRPKQCYPPLSAAASAPEPGNGDLRVADRGSFRGRRRRRGRRCEEERANVATQRANRPSRPPR